MKTSLISYCFLFGVYVQCQISCWDPISHSPLDKERKFIVFGAIDPGSGIGNYLSSFPAVYYISMLTGRELLINDGDGIGTFCENVGCAFPLVSTMARLHPNTVNKNRIIAKKIYEFKMSLSGKAKELTERIYMTAARDSRSEWWLDIAGAKECIQRATGCNSSSDIPCVERHAFQRLDTVPCCISVLLLLYEAFF